MAVQKKTTTVFGALVAMMMVFGGVAYACTNLATLNLSTASGNVGDNVTVTGSSFRTPRGAGDVPMPVELHWNGADGPLLGKAVPDAAGNISASFQVPEGQAGYYVVLATQLDKGVDAYGTPARAAFQILGANGESVLAPQGTQTPAVSGGNGSGILALTVGLGALGLALFAAGFVAFSRQARRQEAPVPAKVRNN
ncbi:MAG: hypothetical protein WD794_04455 [Mycobacteriales bacterium]